MNTEAVVNTANRYPEIGAGVDLAIYEAAGKENLLSARHAIGEVQEGKSFITSGFDLPAKYIIHTVSPLYIDGESGEEEKLRNCYKSALELALENNIRSISFPLVSTGSFGYPMADGLRIAMEEINLFLLNNSLDVYVVVFDREATAIASRLQPELQNYIDENYVEEVRHKEYGTSPIMRDSAARSQAPLMPEAQPQPQAPLMPEAQPRIPIESESNPRMPSASQPTSRSKSKPSFGKRMLSCVFSVDDEEIDEYLDNDECREKDEYLDDEFPELDETGLDKSLRHLSDPFGVYFFYLVEKKSMTSSEVQNRAWITKQVYSKINKNKETYHPDKRTALQLCIGLELNIDETKDFLARAGYALSPCDKQDLIFSFFIENEYYDIIDISDALEKYGLKPILDF